MQKGLDNFFHQFTPENFHALLVQELGDAVSVTGDGCHVTSEAVSPRHSPAEPKLPSEGWSPVTRHFWRGPELLVHIAAGNLPNPALMSMVLGLLTRSAQFVKCAQRRGLPAPAVRPLNLRRGSQTRRLPGNRRMARRQR